MGKSVTVVRASRFIKRLLLKRGIVLRKPSPEFDSNAILRRIWPMTINDELVRVGTKDGDGGYLLPRSSLTPDRVFSPGVDNNASFEQFFLEQGIPCSLADASVSEPPIQHKLISFRKTWLSHYGSDTSVTLEDWVRAESQSNEDLCLQMDIEGAEYEVLLAAPQDILKRFSTIIVELHHLTDASTRMGGILLELFLDKLLSTHTVVHLHPNNCCPGLVQNGEIWPEVLEMTLVRSDNPILAGNMAELPNPLDVDNSRQKSIVLSSPEE